MANKISSLILTIPLQIIIIFILKIRKSIHEQIDHILLAYKQIEIKIYACLVVKVFSKLQSSFSQEWQKWISCLYLQKKIF